MPEIPPALINPGGPIGLLLFVVGLVLTGRLVSRGVHEDRIRDKDQQITRLEKTLDARDETIRVQNERMAVRDEQLSKLLAQSELTVQLLTSLAREAGHADLAT